MKAGEDSMFLEFWRGECADSDKVEDEKKKAAEAEKKNSDEAIIQTPEPEKMQNTDVDMMDAGQHQQIAMTGTEPEINVNSSVVLDAVDLGKTDKRDASTTPNTEPASPTAHPIVHSNLPTRGRCLSLSPESRAAKLTEAMIKGKANPQPLLLAYRKQHYRRIPSDEDFIHVPPVDRRARRLFNKLLADVRKERKRKKRT
ncbi:hypothetical protein P154DRAFT_539846 [Amniculicola lignicola CBS 123094]|uniref:Uncharacterized protein n=1 Tax=Amniculicola lignicola CBS 123094 TaxID=1392246 RepID=A0A6A5W910_9PLEO|nr:hypothetical protein P154DRAFT_539846 [Amniculicola lignicola CBS 123094]